MKTLLSLLVLLLALGAGRTSAADPAQPVYWYRIVAARGNVTQTFTGTTVFTPVEMSERLGQAAAVLLENLRTDNGQPKPNFRWLPNPDGSSVLVPPHTIVYMLVLPGDPMEAKE